LNSDFFIPDFVNNWVSSLRMCGRPRLLEGKSVWEENIEIACLLCGENIVGCVPSLSE